MVYPQSSQPSMSQPMSQPMGQPMGNTMQNTMSSHARVPSANGGGYPQSNDSYSRSNSAAGYYPNNFGQQYPNGLSRSNSAVGFGGQQFQGQQFPGALASSQNSMVGRAMNQKEADLESIISYDKPHHDDHAHPPEPTSLTWKERIEHFTFAWYASTMSTGGVAFVLSVIPFRFDGLTGLGTAMFVFNLFLFTGVTTTMCLRFYWHPHTLKKAFSNPHEGFFFATFWLSIATMITNTTAYGVPNTGPWIFTALRIAFWVYTVCALLVAIVYYHVLFVVHKLVITNVLPGWVLPIFPAMLVGTLASAIAKFQPPEHALPMLVCGLSFQGLGFFIALAMYGLYFGRLVTSGLPVDASRAAMFIAVGPPSFTALAFIGMAQDLQIVKIFPNYMVLNGISNQTLITDILSLFALIMAIFLWVLAFWFFAIAVIAVVEAIPRNDFHLNWYAYVFPNVGFTIATIKIGERLQSPAINKVGTGMGAILFFLWALIVFCHIKAIVYRKIMWPGKDENAAH